jgi:hypothetical protein
VIKNTSANNSRHSLKLQDTSKKLKNSLLRTWNKLIYYKQNCPRKEVRNNLKKNHLPLIQDLGMIPFSIIMRSCNILGTCIAHLHKFMRILLRVWIAWLARWMFRFSSQPYFLCSNDFCGWVVYHSYCVLRCLYVAAIMPTDHSN